MYLMSSGRLKETLEVRIKSAIRLLIYVNFYEILFGILFLKNKGRNIKEK